MKQITTLYYEGKPLPIYLKNVSSLEDLFKPQCFYFDLHELLAVFDLILPKLNINNYEHTMKAFVFCVQDWLGSEVLDNLIFCQAQDSDKVFSYVPFRFWYKLINLSNPKQLTHLNFGHTLADFVISYVKAIIAGFKKNPRAVEGYYKLKKDSNRINLMIELANEELLNKSLENPTKSELKINDEVVFGNYQTEDLLKIKIGGQLDEKYTQEEFEDLLEKLDLLEKNIENQFTLSSFASPYCFVSKSKNRYWHPYIYFFILHSLIRDISF